VVKLSLPPGEAEAYLLAHNALGSKGDPDLGAWDMDMLSAVVGDMQLLDTNLEGLGWDAGELDEIALGGALKGPPGSGGGDDPPPNKADELQEKWGVKVGDLWACGEHRIVCGDCTDQAVVDLVMGGEKAALIHADPPYGMGKEKDGIANDNLYRDKLDVFQMQWWAACRAFVNDNGSAYIWGTAEDLWRLWYCGGLSESERMTMRNEIVWDKKSAGAGGISHQGAEGLRQYPTATERCLFFMLGEQGFNNNSDNYWEGWEPVRSQLEADCKKMGWGQDDIKRICGVGMYSHWFTKSQWTFIPEEHYRKLQEAAREHDDLKREHDDLKREHDDLKREHDAFKREHDDLKREHDDLKREHDDLKREWYATRAHFDNVHDNMTDVWEFARVTGDERQGHATPKPVEMAERAIKSSSNDGDRVLVPFMGTCPELIACERLNRRCMGIELSPAYVAVCLERWHMETGLDPELLT
jgi:DNA modification methylase